MQEIEVIHDKRLIEVQKAIKEIVNVYRDHSFFWKNAFWMGSRRSA